MLISFYSLYLYFALLLAIASGQSPLLPSKASPNLTIGHLYEERVSVANAAINIAMNGALTDPNGALVFHDIFQKTPTFYSQMADFDILTNNKTHYHLLQAQLPLAIADAASSPRVAIVDYLVYGYAATKAYIAYQDNNFLSIAQQNWNLGRTYYISEENIASNKIETKASSIRTECNEKSLLTNSTNGELDTRTTAAFFTLSALLAEATSNTTYLIAANETLQFLKNFAYFPRSNSPQNEKIIYALDTDPPCYSNGYQQWFPVTGDIIEGLSILASIYWDETATQTLLSICYSSCQSASKLIGVCNSLQDAINSSTLYRDNQPLNGVIHLTGMQPGSPTDDPYLVRGLATANRRNHTDPGMRGYIAGFIDIQYNYLLDNATLKEAGVYVDRNSGPPDRLPQKSGLSIINQTTYTMVYVQAIGSGNITSSNSNNPFGNPHTPSNHPGSVDKAAKIGEIVGPVVGGIVTIALLSGLVVCLKRRRRRHQAHLPSIFLTSPFNLPESTERENSLVASPTSPKQVKPRVTVRTDSNTPISPASSSSLRVKTRLDPPIPSSWEPVAVTSTEEQDPNAHTQMDSTPFDDDPHARYHAMSTAEMARILNARLQAEASYADAPPSYPHSRVGH
ncbi:hypothetical protein L218DRAFT_1007920 [Marasmius fiardii PR-910]|nr:hypothetical protein L218DRAFT_1007920 [Marasmius fiardii PR-910]